VVLVGLALVHKPAPADVGGHHMVQSIALGAAKAVHTEIKLAAGELELAGGASSLLEGDFSYDRASQRPEVSYNVTGSDGELRIDQPNADHIQFGGNQRSYWTLRFNNQVPLDLAIKMGAGTGRLNLNGLQLSRFSVEGGAGTLDVDMSGDWKKSVDGHISGGVGTVTVHLPTSVGVSVTAHGGLGSVNAADFIRNGDVYVNSLYGKSPISLTLDIQGGIGTINLESGP
jgi:hypothetical protein